MGYRGKQVEQTKARELRAEGWTYKEICAELGVARSSVSLWVRDVEIDDAAWRERAGENFRRGNHYRRPSRLKIVKEAEIEDMLELGRRRIGDVSERDLLVAGTALYAGEGGKRDGAVKFTNSDPRMIRSFLVWLRQCFVVDETRLRLRLYLHQGLDLAATNDFWSELTGIPLSQFGQPYRAAPDPTIRKAKHIHGCLTVVYNCSRTHREIMGLVHALLSSGAPFRGSSDGRAFDC